MKKSSIAMLLMVLVVGFSSQACRKSGAVSPNYDAGSINLTKIYFDFDQYSLSSESRAILEQHAAWLKQGESRRLTIEGHTDEWGTDEYNIALGERRAMAAKNYLINLGISTDRIATISYGESRPADPSHHDAAWAKNRRDEFKGKK